METMIALCPEVTAQVLDLIRLNVQSAARLRDAAERVKNPVAGQTLRICAGTREDFGQELRAVLRACGEYPQPDGAGTEATPPSFAGEGNPVAPLDDGAVLAQAQQFEEVLKSRYESLIPGVMDQPIAEVLQRQSLSIRRVCERLRALRLMQEWEAQPATEHR